MRVYTCAHVRVHERVFWYKHYTNVCGTMQVAFWLRQAKK